LHTNPFQANDVNSGGFEALFTPGANLFKGYELKLLIDDSVKPVAQPVRRIPFGLQEKVDKKLNQPLRLIIIEEVSDGPSGLISPLPVSCS